MKDSEVEGINIFVQHVLVEELVNLLLSIPHILRETREEKQETYRFIRLIRIASFPSPSEKFRSHDLLVALVLLWARRRQLVMEYEGKASTLQP